MPLVRAGGAPCPAPPRPAAGPAFGVAVATSALATGAGPVGAGVARAPRADVQALARRAGLYAAGHAGGHGARLKAPVIEGRAVPMRPDARPTRAVPPIGTAGHARRHPGAEPAAGVAHGATLAAPPDGTPGVPAFAGRLGPGGIDAIPTRVKSRRPAGIRVRQAALDPGGAQASTVPTQDPARPLPTGCLPSPPRSTPSEPVRHEPIPRAVSATGSGVRG